MSRQYYDPWAKVAQSATNAYGQYLSSRPNVAQQEARGAMADKYRTEAALNQSQLDAPENLKNIFSQIFSPQQEAPSPNFVGPMDQYEGGKPPADVVQQRYQENLPDLFSNAMRFAGNKPGGLGDIFQAFAANAGASPEQLTRAQMGAGMNYANTKEGFDSNQNKDFTLSPGSIRYDSAGKPIVSAPFKPGGSGPSFRVLPDGTVEYGEDGLGGPGLTKPVVGDLQRKDIEMETYQLFSKEYEDALLKSPGGTGTRGNLARISDSLLGQVQQFSPDSEIAGKLDSIKNNLAGQFTDPETGEIVNQDLYNASTIAEVLPYMAAGAITGQSGRGLSDTDYKIVQRAVGSPNDWMATPDKLLARKRQLDKLVVQLRQNYQGRLDNSDRSFTPDNQPQVSPPKPGDIVDGYRFIGGRPDDQNSWEVAQ